MERNSDIIFFYEHAARELDVACAVVSLLQKKYGLRCEVVQWPYGYHLVAGNCCPKVVVLPFCYSSRSFQNCLMDWRKAVYFNMAWEQLFYSGNRTAKSPRGEFACRHVIHHAWSDMYAEFLFQSGVQKENIFINGQPAYALYDEPYRRYFRQRGELARQYGLDPERRWIFFPENYNWAFYSGETLKRFIADGQSAEDISIMREYCITCLNEVVKWCSDAAVKGVEVILRPRPAVTLEQFRDAVLKIVPTIPEGLHLIQGETVREWIMASDTVVSSHSTSLIEAAVSGRPAYMIEPYPMPRALSVEWHALVSHIRSRTDFLEVCLGRGDDNFARLGDWARSVMMSKGDAIGNLAGRIASLCCGEISYPQFPTRKSAVEHLGHPALSWFLYQYHRIGGRRYRLEPPETISPELVKDLVSSEEISCRVLKWGNVLQ